MAQRFCNIRTRLLVFVRGRFDPCRTVHQIGITDINTPDFSDAVAIGSDELPVFWACGVTPQIALENACPPIAITHVPGKMLLTERLNEELAVL